MSTYYGEVMSDQTVRDMVERVLKAAEDACLRDACITGERTAKLHELKLAEIAAVREIVMSQLEMFRGDEFRSNGPAQRIAAIIGYREE